MQHYVCGFLYSLDRVRVLLIRKNRPAWQAGKLNGVGGKVEAGETFPEAMRREFREEAELDLPESTWQHVLTLSGKDDQGLGRAWAGHFFRAFGDIDSTVGLTDERLEIIPVNQIPSDTIPNLRWMIPLFLDEEPCERAYDVTFQTKMK